MNVAIHNSNHTLTRPVFVPKTNTSRTIQSESDGEVLLSNGLAKTGDGSDFTGTISFFDKEGNEWNLGYVSGKIQSSQKNGKLFKQYEYEEHIPDKMREKISLPDDSYIYDEDFFDMRDTETSIIKDENNRTAYILKNYFPKYKDEPILKCLKNNTARKKL